VASGINKPGKKEENIQTGQLFFWMIIPVQKRVSYRVGFGGKVKIYDTYSNSISPGSFTLSPANYSL
jgi:hypothetical protein